MITIKRFIDKVSLIEGKRTNTVVLPIEEARILRDELAKLLADNYELLNKQNKNDQVIQVEINGGNW
jgi:5-bromo-4-chloroindolyl phosphate hydrolysis protein